NCGAGGRATVAHARPREPLPFAVFERGYARRNCLARLPPVFPRKSVVSSSTRGRFWAYEAVNPRFPPEKQGLDALNNYRSPCSISFWGWLPAPVWGWGRATGSSWKPVGTTPPTWRPLLSWPGCLSASEGQPRRTEARLNAAPPWAAAAEHRV